MKLITTPDNRKEIDKIQVNWVRIKTDKTNLIKSFENKGVYFLKRHDEVERGDCQAYALRKLGLLKYVNEENFSFLLRRGLIPCLEQTDRKKEGNLVVYGSKDGIYYDHYGILIKKDYSLMVESKWGVWGDIFIHETDSVPTFYGEYYDFFRLKKDKINDSV